MISPVVLRLDDPRATSSADAGAKAANLAVMAAAGLPILPGFVITTHAIEEGALSPEAMAAIRPLFEELHGDTEPLVVRSSSTIEDATTSSMAGRFTSLLDIVGWERFLGAVREVAASADTVRDDAGARRPIGVLVQRQVDAPLGGVLFGVDPVTGETDHVVVEVVPSRPDVLVDGTSIADHYVLTRRGRVITSTSTGGTPPLPWALRRSLVRLAHRAERELGAPQDIEWCTDRRGRLWMLQTRPVTATSAVGGRRTVLLGPGPVAETFPAPLRPLEDDLWVTPLRTGITRALEVSSAASRTAIERSPVVTTVGGWTAVDLALIGATRAGSGRRTTLNPVTALRRLATAWRVGRLELALPAMADAVVATVDRDLAAVPPLSELTLEQLADLLERTGRELATVHSYEVLAGMLLHEEGQGTMAAAALQALADARGAGWDDVTTIARTPVVLALCPPDLDGPRLPTGTATMAGATSSVADLGRREALRLRTRWLQELGATITREVGRRLVARGVLTDVSRLPDLRLDELTSMAAGGPPPARLATTPPWRPGPPLPSTFRLDAGGEARQVDAPGRRRAPARPGSGLPAGGGRGVGVVRHAPPVAREEGIVLVVRHLEPQLASALVGLSGLVAETGSALSHLAILAREAGVPTVVGVTDARSLYPPGTRLVIDGTTGDIEVQDDAAVGS